MVPEGVIGGDANGEALRSQEEGRGVDDATRLDTATVGGEAGPKHLPLYSSWNIIIDRLNRHEDWLHNLEVYKKEKIEAGLKPH